jgi:hypothetical protein
MEQSDGVIELLLRFRGAGYREIDHSEWVVTVIQWPGRPGFGCGQREKGRERNASVDVSDRAYA